MYGFIFIALSIIMSCWAGIWYGSYMLSHDSFTLVWVAIMAFGSLINVGIGTSIIVFMGKKSN